jgi:multidrug efflux pump subunit AcrA (membrane-fusion protein)
LVAEQSAGRIAVAPDRRPRKWFSRAGAAAQVGTVVAMAASGCKRGDAQAGMHERPPPAVTVAPAITQNVPVYIDQIGKTAPLEIVNVMPRITGQISERPFTDGQEVTTKTILYQIDPELYKTILAQADANVNQAAIALKWANREFDRIKGLVDNKAVSKQDYVQ